MQKIKQKAKCQTVFEPFENKQNLNYKIHNFGYSSIATQRKPIDQYIAYIMTKIIKIIILVFAYHKQIKRFYLLVTIGKYQN